MANFDETVEYSRFSPRITRDTTGTRRLTKRIMQNNRRGDTMRVNITLNTKNLVNMYLTSKNKRNTPGRLQLKKYSQNLLRLTLCLQKLEVNIQYQLIRKKNALIVCWSVFVLFEIISILSTCYLFDQCTFGRKRIQDETV